jgi:alpha-1,3-glucan synthase
MYIPFSIFVLLAQTCFAARFSQDQVLYNLNQNESAEHPLAYWGKWGNHSFHPSPTNWRFPFYTFFLDRYVSMNGRLPSICLH